MFRPGYAFSNNVFSINNIKRRRITTVWICYNVEGNCNVKDNINLKTHIIIGSAGDYLSSESQDKLLHFIIADSLRCCHSEPFHGKIPGTVARHDTDGKVSIASDVVISDSDLPHSGVSSCIVRHVKLVDTAREHGVIVVYVFYPYLWEKSV